MFSNKDNTYEETKETKDEQIKNNVNDKKTSNKYQIYNDDSAGVYNSVSPCNIDAILENEKKHNIKDSWNKLDNTIKKRKLHVYTEQYGIDNKLNNAEIKQLKGFFSESLRKNKLQKTKDVIYDKETGIISSIPSLCFNKITRNFTLKITDTKRVSTLKSLTPKRCSNKNKPSINDKIEDKNTSV